MLDFKKIQNKQAPLDNKVVLDNEATKTKDIAIIGLDLQFPMADGPEQFWNKLSKKTDMVGTMSANRLKDTRNTLAALHLSTEGIDHSEAAYLDEIDKFDYSFFRISPKEAALMDPHQRLFLQTAWKAIENAGCSDQQLAGSRTGIFVGCGSESEYRRTIAALDPTSLAHAVSGNVKPIVAGRLAYFLDLHGPNMMIDTTCSSSLVAVHLACRSLRDGECSMAIAGGIQLHLAPVRHAEIGIEASDGRTRTFDDLSDGTGTGEGVAAVVLKPLDAALRDRDHIYAVIKGSAVNHDGNSNGITAPNAKAQEDVIIRAWEDAGVDPETITLWEAHGTGTKLGDPIEIDGIRRAFGKFTNKKSFCAIGSVKSNIGHLDHCAGLAGLLKGVLALHHRMLPATLHFGKPNRKINFEDSPIYVNDRLAAWETNGIPRRCGISSFGISGTNSHIVLEEAPMVRVEPVANKQLHTEVSDVFRIMTISAKSKAALTEYMQSYIAFLEANHLDHSDDHFANLCYSASTGRGHYGFRLALIDSDQSGVIAKLKEILPVMQDQSTGLLSTIEGVYYGEHRLVSGSRDHYAEHEISEQQANELGAKALDSVRSLREHSTNQLDLLGHICRLYAEGANIEWGRLYDQEHRYRMPLPTYPFAGERCWIEGSAANIDKSLGKDESLNAPLLDRYIAATIDSDIFLSVMSTQKHWLLDEHRIGGKAFLVGTAYLEMVSEAMNIKLGNAGMDPFEFRDVVFISPMIFDDEDTREVHTVIRKTASGHSWDFYSASRLITSEVNSSTGQVDDWVIHVEGKVSLLSEKRAQRIALSGLLAGSDVNTILPDMDEYNDRTVFVFGPRWKNMREIQVGEQEIVTRIEMPNEYIGEIVNYSIYPPLLDNALATIPLIEKVLGSDGERVYLPFSYKKIKVYEPLPKHFYSHIYLKNEISDRSELLTFDVTLYSPTGEVIAEIEQYSLKKTPKKIWSTDNKETSYLGIDWVEYPPSVESTESITEPDRKVWVVGGEPDFAVLIQNELLKEGHQVTYTAFEELKADSSQLGIPVDLHNIIFLCDAKEDESSDEKWLAATKSLFQMTKTLLKSDVKTKVMITIIASNVYRVSGTEEALHPQHATAFGLGKVIREEYSHLDCKCIDIDNETPLAFIIQDVLQASDMFALAYRNGTRYAERLSSKEVDENREISIRQDGTYLITGGLGGIGLELGKALASEHVANIAIVGRSGLPPREDWDRIVQAGDEPDQIRKINGIQEMEANGSQVDIFTADVADLQQMREVIASVHNKFGSIQGIIHSAGVPGNGFLINKSDEEFIRVLAPKVLGTVNLDLLTSMDNLDFFINCSSNTTLMGVPGQGDYTAGNAFQDAFSSYRRLKGKPTLTINWPAWKETGMAYNHGLTDDNLFRSLPTIDGVSHFFKLIGQDTDRFIVGDIVNGGSLHGKTINDARMVIDPVIRKAWTRDNPRKASKSIEAISDSRADVILTGSDKVDYSDTEYQVASVWKQVLGFGEINVFDSFFDIGGDSIQITKVQSLLDMHYTEMVTVADLFTHTTIRQIATHIASQMIPQKQQVLVGTADGGLMEQQIRGILDQLAIGQINLEQAMAKYEFLGNVS